ncbi:MAG: multidrug MFS transporter [Paenibacillaceae bacterium]|nr:multidrug MFS transporter [Paenibacillaceae bacterium]
MIFVTVGTHEQPFTRLVKCIDEMIRDGLINEKVIIQIGYSLYEPHYCTYQKLYTYNEMVKLINEARIVITHGGPSSFIMPLQIGKIPIVVPRQLRYKEHVNDHQVIFCEAVEKRQGNIIVVKDLQKLINVIEDYDDVIKYMPNKIICNNTKFCMELEMVTKGLFK